MSAPTTLSEALRNLAVGESHSIMFRVELKKYHNDNRLAEMKRMNNSVGALASRIGSFTVERVTTLNSGGTHVLFGLVITREA